MAGIYPSNSFPQVPQLPAGPLPMNPQPYQGLDLPVGPHGMPAPSHPGPRYPKSGFPKGNILDPSKYPDHLKQSIPLQLPIQFEQGRDHGEGNVDPQYVDLFNKHLSRHGWRTFDTAGRPQPSSQVRPQTTLRGVLGGNQ